MIGDVVSQEDYRQLGFGDDGRSYVVCYEVEDYGKELRRFENGVLQMDCSERLSLGQWFRRVISVQQENLDFWWHDGRVWGSDL